MAKIDTLPPSFRKRVQPVHDRILGTLKFHGKRFTLKHFSEATSDMQKLRDSGAFTFSTKTGVTGRIVQIEFAHDIETSKDLIAKYLDAYIDGEMKKESDRQAGKCEKAKVERAKESAIKEHTRLPVTGTVYKMSEDKHWQRSESKGHQYGHSSLGGNSIACHI